MTTRNILTKSLRPKILLSTYQIGVIKNIRKTRKELGITQKSLAGKVGLSQSYIAAIENFEQFPSDESLKKMLAILNINYLEIPKIESRNIDKIPLSDNLILDKRDAILLNNNMKKTIPLSDNIKIIINDNDTPDKLYYGYYIEDDSLNPEIKKNDLVIIEFMEIDVNDKYNNLKSLNTTYFVAVNESGTEAVIRKLATPKFKVNYTEAYPLVLRSVSPDYYSYELYASGGYTKFKIDINNKNPYDIQKYDREKWYIKGTLLFAIEEKTLF
ncbi:MAG: helix-turn-helix domain-containing protein [bacterium]